MKRIIPALIVLLITSPAYAGVTCFGGASLGVSANATSISDGTTQVSLGTASPMVSPELGCTFATSLGVNVGVIGRLDFMNSKAIIEDYSVSNRLRWAAIGTIGTNINPSTAVYVGAGISGTQFKADGESQRFNGFVGALGFSTAIGKTGLNWFAEYNLHLARAETIAEVKVSPRDHAARTGFRHNF